MAKKREAKTANLCARIAMPLHRQIRTACAERGMSVQDFVVTAVVQHLLDHEAFKLRIAAEESDRRGD